MELEQESIFSLSTELDNVWHGIDKLDTQQVLLDAGSPSSTVIGTGVASGVSSFSWNSGSNEWWSPVNSYFLFKFRFIKYSGINTNAIPIFDDLGNLRADDLVCYCDNFVSTLFTSIMTYINGSTIDNITQPWVIDQVLTYSNAKKNFLDTFGSLSASGESLQTRLLNTYNNNTGVVTVCYRPPCSLYNVDLVPPGAQHKIEFTWNQNIVNAFESLIGSIDGKIGVGDGKYNILLDSFYFYKATAVPSKVIPLPVNGVIPLTSCNVKQYPISGTNSFQQNINLAPTTNRIYLTFQDISQTPKVTNQTTASTSPFVDATTSIKYMGYGTGWNPITSFSKSFSTSNGCILTELQQLYIQVADLALLLPHPPYNFDNGGSDYKRAYMDWANCVGTKYNDTGSVPFGSAIQASNTNNGSGLFSHLKICGANVAYGDLITGTALTNVSPDSLVQLGNKSNQNQLSFSPSTVPSVPYAAGTIGRSLYFQTYENGWLGRYPGPIFAFNVCRPSGTKVSSGNIQVSFTGQPSSVLANVLCSYNLALAVSRNERGAYDFQLVSGQ